MSLEFRHVCRGIHQVLLLLCLSSGVLLSQEKLPFHEAVNNGAIEVRCTNFSQEKISLHITPKSAAGATSIRIDPGTWIEFSGYPKAGRLFFVFPKKGGTINLANRRNGWVYQWIAVPEQPSAVVPVVEKRKTPEIRILRAGFDPALTGLLGSDGSLNREDTMGRAAALLLSNRPKLSLAEFSNYIERAFASRLNEEETKLKAKPGDREYVRVVWKPTLEHLKMGEHLIEKSRFLRNPPKPGEAQVTLADAMAKGHITGEMRKGVSSLMILRLTRTPTAPPGPMQVTTPPGTVLHFDDKGDGNPVKLYPLHDGTIDLFGEIADGVQLPCINGSYKRRIKTTRVIPIKSSFDAKIGALFQNRRDTDRLAMAVEAILHERSDLDPGQIQYHINQVRVPFTEDTVVTEDLIADARARLAGDTPPSPAPPKVAMSTQPAPAAPEPTSRPTGPTPKPAPSDSIFGITRSAGEKGVRIDPNVPSDPLNQLAGARNANAMWRKMVAFVPEYPESAVVGTWTSVPEAEARQYVLALRMHAMETAAAAEGQAIPPQLKQMIAANTELDQKMTHCYTGTLTFSPNGEVTGTYRGPNYPAPRTLKTRWRFDGVQKIDLNPSPVIKDLIFAANGCLVFHDDEGSGILLVLRKQ